MHPFAKATVEKTASGLSLFQMIVKRIVISLTELKFNWIKFRNCFMRPGCNTNDTDKSLFAEAVETAKKADVVIMTLGEASCNE